MERTEESKLILVQPLHPADSFHVFKQCLPIRQVMYVHLSEERRVAIQGEMRERRHQKTLTKNELLDRPTLIGSIVDHDVREYGDARQRVGDCFWVVRLEIKEFSLMSHKLQANRGKISCILIRAPTQRGELRFIIRAKMISTL